MKKLVLLTLVAASLGSIVTSASAQQLKIGTVDMKKVFESYYKTKDAEQRINEARNSAKKELDDRNESLKKLDDEARKLDAEANRPELGKESKDAKLKARDEKVAELRSLDREIKEFQSTRERQLQEQSVRMRSGIVDEINKIVEERVKSEQFELVFDKSGPSLNGVPVVLYAKPGYDFTTDVVTALNKTKGTDTASSSDATKTAPTAPAATGTKKPK